MPRGASQPLLGELGPSRMAIATLTFVRLLAVLLAILVAASALRGLIVPKGRNRMASLQSEFLKSFVPNSTLSMHLLELTREPHVAGSPENMGTADYVHNKWQEFGMENVYFADYPVLLSYPISRQLSMESPVKLNLTHREASVDGDSYSSNTRVKDLFLGYSQSGDVTAEVVYANYGRTEDFVQLLSLGVNCSGKIVLMRYGQIYRGDKVNNAALAGGLGAIIFSDPLEAAPDGTDPSHVYPNSKWLPPTGGQRGSLYQYAGDPETPGWPSTHGGERLSKEETEDYLPKIPAMPIGYIDARPILERLGGQEAPKSWWDGISRESHGLGPGPVVLRMVVEMDNGVHNIRNVIASIRGSEEPDRYVVMGNHRDAWTFGAADPNSGTASILAVAETFGRLLQSGWRPRRTIILCSWDAEEYGLIGSTEWVENNEELLRARAVAYLNVDVAVSGGGFSASACPQMDQVLMEVASQVSDPDKGGLTLYDTWLELTRRDTPGSSIPQVDRLGGAGSDFSAFLQHVGVTAVDFGFGAELAHDYPMYHTVYDNYNWMSKFGDPGFHRHVACGQMWGLLALRLSDDPVLPFSYDRYGETLMQYSASLQDSLSGNTASMATLWQAVARFQAAANHLMTEAKVLKTVSHSLSGSNAQRELNDRMLMAERAMLDPEGLGGKRSWYRHMIYAPAVDDGYASVAFPGIADSMSADVARLQHEIFRVARAIDRSAAVLFGDLV